MSSVEDETKPYYLSYWRRNNEGHWVSCERHEAPTRVDVVQRKGPYTIEHTFDFLSDADMHRCNELRRALQWAFEYGQQYRSRQINDCLTTLGVI